MKTKNLLGLFALLFCISFIGCKSDSAKNSASSNDNATSATSHEGHAHNETKLADTADGIEAASATLMDDPSNGVDAVKETITEATNEMAAFSVNAAGDLVDVKGNVIAKAGNFSIKDGVYIDAEGKKIGVLKKIGRAVGNAAEKTADAMKQVFSGMFKSKEKVGSTYLLSKIDFDNESHRITNFSKGEVEGLAAALKEMPDAKIQVQVHGDGKKVTGLRAEVIKNMLVTLGVNKKQISSKGMGGDVNAEKVEIMVEQTVKN